MLRLNLNVAIATETSFSINSLTANIVRTSAELQVFRVLYGIEFTGRSTLESVSPGASRCCQSKLLGLHADQNTVQTFPMEVIYEILQYAHHTELPSIALTCQRYKPEAERLLYQRITFPECNKSTRSCLRTLAAVPQKALLVRSFWIHWRKLLAASTFRLLGKALLAMTSLKVLHLRFFHDRDEPARTVMNSFLKYVRGLFMSSSIAEPDTISTPQAMHIFARDALRTRSSRSRGMDPSTKRLE